jgi:hypothetical protein
LQGDMVNATLRAVSTKPLTAAHTQAHSRSAATHTHSHTHTATQPHSQTHPYPYVYTHVHPATATPTHPPTHHTRTRTPYSLSSSARRHFVCLCPQVWNAGLRSGYDAYVASDAVKRNTPDEPFPTTSDDESLMTYLKGVIL